MRASPEKITYYEILGVKENATPEQIRETYRKSALQYKDVRGSDQVAQSRRDEWDKIQDAYKVLSNEKSKNTYDILRKTYAGQADKQKIHDIASQLIAFEEEEWNKAAQQEEQMREEAKQKGNHPPRQQPKPQSAPQPPKQSAPPPKPAPTPPASQPKSQPQKPRAAAPNPKRPTQDAAAQKARAIQILEQKIIDSKQDVSELKGFIDAHKTLRAGKSYAFGEKSKFYQLLMDESKTDKIVDILVRGQSGPGVKTDSNLEIDVQKILNGAPPELVAKMQEINRKVDAHLEGQETKPTLGERIAAFIQKLRMALNLLTKEEAQFKDALGELSKVGVSFNEPAVSEPKTAETARQIIGKFTEMVTQKSSADRGRFEL